MPRVTFSNELNDFVKSFTAGAAIADAAEDRRLKAEKNAIDREEVQAKKGYYEAYARRFGGADDEMAPLIQEGVNRFGPGGAGAPTAVPAEPAATSAGKPQPPAFINAINDRYSLPPGYLSNTAFIESHYDPNAHAKGSSAAGLFQFTNGTAKDYGLTNRYDALQSTEAAARLAVDDGKLLSKHLGRAPTDAELYLAHQQGGKGALLLLQNPDTPAVALLGRDAVLNNGGEKALGMTGREFANMWLRKYEAAKGKHAAIDVDAPSQLAAQGGTIRRYEEGGAVPAEPAQQEKPYYINDLMDDVGSAMGKLGEVVHAGLQGLQEKFGLNERPAVAEADPDYNNRVAAFVRNDGVPPPEQVEALRSKVDPENRLGAALGTTYGMVKAYDHYLAKGDVKSAQGVATSLIQYTKAQSQQLGALAVQAIQAGDTTSAAKALAQAYNTIPNGKEATVEGNKVTITDERTGKVIEQKEFTPDMLMNAAMGMTTGKAFLDDLSQFAASEKMQIAGIQADAKRDVAGIRTGSAEKIAGETNETRRDIARGRDETSRANTQETNETRRAVGAGHDETSRANTAETNQTRRDVGAGHDAASLERVDKRNEGALDLEGKRQEGRSSLETQRQTGRETITDKNNASREGRLDKRLEAQTQRQTTKDTTGRQSKEIDRVDKFTDHQILGADEAVTPKVSADQAQKTRNIARGILEAGGDKYGDSAVSIARKLTAFDPSTRSLKTNFKLSEGKDGYAVTLPDGSRVPINDNGYRTLKEIQDRMGARK